jgi:multidrug resistance efflux pump
VVVARAARSPIVISLEYAARIRPREEIVVSSKISGRVAEVKASVGQRVGRGDTLFTIESEDSEAQFRQAKAALESARANLTRTSDSSLSSQLIQAEAAVKQAQVQYDDAKDLFDRTERLYAGGAASRQQRDGAEARFKSGGIALEAAKQSLALLQEKGGPQSTGLASTQVDQAQATADLARSQLANTTVTSPIAGIVSACIIDPGELVSSSVPAFVVIDVRSLIAEANLPESMVEKVRVGQRMEIVVESAGNARMRGIVDTISPAPDPRTQSYAVKVRIDAPAEGVRPGMFARLFIPVESRENALVVPNSAVITESGVDFVLTVVEGRVAKRTVEIGLSDASATEIVNGLEEGSLVITEGQSFLNEGDRVSPVR